MIYPVRLKQLFIPVLLLLCLSGFTPAGKVKHPSFSFPWKNAGLSENEAAAHLLSRFTYGYTPAMISEVERTGLEKWFSDQLNAKENDDSLNTLLQQYDALPMSNGQIAERYTDPGKLVKMAVEDGVISKDEVAKLKEGDKAEYRRKLMAYMKEKGLKPRADLNRQLICQKILRAAYSQNQLREVMTAFWFNHFNVSLTKPQSASFTLPYERDVIRPNALGNFGDLLLATAKSPAMLLYLDNDKSRVDNANATAKQQRQQQRLLDFVEQKQEKDSSLQQLDVAGKMKAARKSQGLNENYAREVMELHTLGVDGGYTQSDVTEGARILTGWMVYPVEGMGRKAMEKLQEKLGPEQLARNGFVHEGDFMFAANRHDYGSKQFLGKSYPPGRGYDEGLDLLHTLANHPSTAKFISKKLAIRFVQDDPPASLVDQMAATFQKTGGDIKAVLVTMVSSPEFWSKAAVREKIKSPFELLVSAVRVTGARISNPYPLYRWMEKMGEPVYSYQAPTGFPDKSQFWVNTGSLLYRMNFGLAFAMGKIDGISYDEKALNNYHEPESLEAALETYGAILMPARDLKNSNERLLKLLKDPAIESKIEAAANSTPQAKQSDEEALMEDASTRDAKNTVTTNTIRQVIGILLGSPEFQRR